MAICNSCNAPITWATSAKTGRPMPIDLSPVADGNLVVIKGVASPATDEDRKLHRDTFKSHFATCPDAPTWRKSKT